MLVHSTFYEPDERPCLPHCQIYSLCKTSYIAWKKVCHSWENHAMEHDAIVPLFQRIYVLAWYHTKLICIRSALSTSEPIAQNWRAWKDNRLRPFFFYSDRVISVKYIWIKSNVVIMMILLLIRRAIYASPWSKCALLLTRNIPIPSIQIYGLPCIVIIMWRLFALFSIALWWYFFTIKTKRWRI